MKKTLFITIFMLIGVMVFARTRSYVNPKFPEIAKHQKIIAIIPFTTTIQLRPKQMRNTTPEQLESMEINEGKGIQNGVIFLVPEKRIKGQTACAGSGSKCDQCEIKTSWC